MITDTTTFTEQMKTLAIRDDSAGLLAAYQQASTSNEEWKIPIIQKYINISEGAFQNN